MRVEGDGRGGAVCVPLEGAALDAAFEDFELGISVAPMRLETPFFCGVLDQCGPSLSALAAAFTGTSSPAFIPCQGGYPQFGTGPASFEGGRTARPFTHHQVLLLVRE